MFCLKKSGHAKRSSGGESKNDVRFRIEALEQPKRNQQPEPAVAVVLGIGHDAVDAQDGERRGEEQSERPCGRRAPAQRCERDPPREHRAQAADDCDVENVVKEDAAREADDRGLDEKRERRVRQGKSRYGIWPRAMRAAVFRM